MTLSVPNLTIRVTPQIIPHLRATLLLAPLVLFLGVFFLWPLASMMRTAVSDEVMLRVFPSMPAAVAGWKDTEPPTAAMQAALVFDLRAASDQQAIGDAVRRLNAAQAGFRSLMGRTVSAIRANDAEVDLVSIDGRWAEPRYWKAIVDGLSPYTSRFILAAVDLGYAGNGSFVRLPPETSTNQSVFLRTFWIALQVTVACVVIGFPFALVAASVEGIWRQVLLSAILIPMWTSVLVRAAAWFILLQEQGLLNGMLQNVGLTSGPVPLLFNRAGVVIAMTHMLLPFMVLPIFSVLVSIPKGLMPAAASLGANPLRAFWRVLLPLSLRGIVSGSVLVFMTSIGFYIMPALLGGPTDQLISSFIAFYAIGSANWQMASALGIILLAATMGLYAVYSRLSVDRNSGI
ncbi:ABC transporter permease (plasmid) [Agrobacterium leguminum]|uniref:Spermidine/putrescine ABC transporter (Permease protein) n=1 Tax=Agrobacterium deltaense NCPPB 1641 TaxID=1183425 RepID=A0A1S7U9M1_9HYPH|nr:MULTISPECIES: ABC transporter permease [Agrobacterium]WFS69618.1 ABC transporter permease [Agrobacterium leguminum]CVI63573.1 putative Spermidine/putrescine ABC transporter (permease protein) [Agrobacterium deltaense NCPPB 1641]